MAEDRFTIIPSGMRSPPAKGLLAVAAGWLFLFDTSYAALSETAACGDIQAQIEDAIAHDRHSLSLPAGARCESEPLVFSGVRDFHLDGSDATIIFSRSDVPGILINDQTRNLRIDNLTIDYFPLPFTQGIVTAIDGQEATVTIDDGYPSLSDLGKIDRAYLFDAQTRKWKEGVSTIYLRDTSFADDGRVGILTLSSSSVDSAEVGDPIAINPRGSPAILINGLSGNISISDVTILSSPGMGIVTRFAEGPNDFQIQVKRGPVPPGATTPRLLSTNADAFNYAYSRGGPSLQNSLLSGMGDDGVNLHALVMSIARREEHNVVIAARPFGNGRIFADIMRPGDRIRFLSPDDFRILGAAEIQSASVIDLAARADAPSVAERFPKSHMTEESNVTLFRLELSADVPEEAAFLDFPHIGASGFVIRDNVFEDSRGHAIVSGASNGVIEGNTIRRLTQNGINIGPLYDPWREGAWVEDVVVRGNRVEHTCSDPTTLLGPEAWALGAITVGAHINPTDDAKQQNFDVIIEDNEFVGNLCTDIDFFKDIDFQTPTQDRDLPDLG